MPLAPDLEPLQAIVGAAVDFTDALSEPEGWKLLRERFSPDARLAKEIDAANVEWWAGMWAAIRDHAARMCAEEQASAFDRITSDLEAATILANYIADAHREPLKSRRELLQHAAAGLVDLDLTVPQLARIWRLVRELDAADVLTLYSLWLVPSRDKCDEVRWEIWNQSGAEALLASGAIRVTFKGGFGMGTRPQLEIGRTARLLLSGLRSFLATKPRPAPPGHEVTAGFRSEAEAQEMLSTLPGITKLRAYQNTRFTRVVQYDAPNVGAGASPRGRAQLLFREFSPEDVAGLPITRRDVPMGTPVEYLWFEQVSPGDTDGTKTLFLMGPHDALRCLAYDLFAAW
jgi:hypothetical protein